MPNEVTKGWECRKCGNFAPKKTFGVEKIELVDKKLGFTRIKHRRRCNRCGFSNGG